jgi:hypothetical protein
VANGAVCGALFVCTCGCDACAVGAALVTEPMRFLAFLVDGVPPCGRVLVRTGRIAVIACTDEELAGLPPDALVWSATEPPPSGLPALDADELDFVAACAASAEPRIRLRDGEDWDSPGAVPPK